MGNINDMALEEIPTAELETYYDDLNAQTNDIGHINKGRGNTPEFWGLVARKNKVFQVLERRKARNSPEQIKDSTGQI